jgi:hypothetical protein
MKSADDTSEVPGQGKETETGGHRRCDGTDSIGCYCVGWRWLAGLRTPLYH